MGPSTVMNEANVTWLLLISLASSAAAHLLILDPPAILAWGWCSECARDSAAHLEP